MSLSFSLNYFLFCAIIWGIWGMAMSKGVEKPLEFHIVYCEKQNGSQEIILGFLKKITERGKEKYDLFKFSVETKEDMVPLEKYIESLQKQNPNIQIKFCSKKEFMQNQELKKVMHDHMLSHIAFSLFYFFALLGIYFFSFSLGFDSTNIFLLLISLGYTYSSVTQIIRNNHYIKKIYPKLKISVYLFELLYTILLSTISFTPYKEKKDLTVNATASVVSEIEEDSVFMGLESTEEKVDVLFNTLRDNSNITEEESEFFKAFDSYYEQNLYLDYEKINNRYENLNIISNFQFNGGVRGQTMTNFFFNQIQLGRHATNSTFYHEVVHLNGGLPFNFLNEGVAVWLTEEFCPYEVSDSADHYYASGLFIRMLSEVLGADVCLHSYSDENMGAINDALLEIIPDREMLSNLYSKLDNTNFYFMLLQISYYFDFNTVEIRSNLYDNYIESYRNLFQALSPYVEQKLGVSLEEGTLMSGDHLCQQYASIILGYEPRIDEKKLKRYFNP